MRKRDYSLVGEGHGAWVRISQIIRRRGSLVLYFTLNTLWCMQYAALAILSYYGIIILQNLLISEAYGFAANLEGQKI
jgi:hypothetical protein